MSNKEQQQNNQLIQELSQEQVDVVAGAAGELTARYMRIRPEDTKGG